MAVNDPIADMLTRIRNAGLAKHREVSMPSSKMKVEVARILQDEGYIKSYKVLENAIQPALVLELKYTQERRPKFVITGLKRVSKPGRRLYTRRDSIPWVKSGLGVAVLSTSQGIVTDRQARQSNIGGELLCYIW
jgi:small subunit ribosomal protein S8